MDTIVQPGLQETEIPKHAPHTVKDDVDTLLDKREKQKQMIRAKQDMLSMRGFTKVYKCSECGRRLEPIRGMDGTPQYGACPYCKTGTVPNSESHYAGEIATSDLGKTDRYAKSDADAFDEGSKNFGGQGTSIRFNARRET